MTPQPIEDELVPYGYLQLIRTLAALSLIIAHEIGRLPVVNKFLKSVFTDSIPLASVPGDVDRAHVEKKVKEFTSPLWINFLLVFFTGLELLAWTVVFGDSLGKVLDQDVPDETLKKSTKLAAGMILVWVSASLLFALTGSSVCSST